MSKKLSALLAGPTDKTKILRFGKISSEDYPRLIEDTAREVAKYISQVNLIPDEGIPLDIARAYKKFSQGNVAGFVPKGGYELLEKYFSECDAIEEFDLGWSGLNTCLSLKGDCIVTVGLSSGTIVELGYTKYHKKYLQRNIPIFLDERTISRRLNAEMEEELNLHYFNSANELGKLLKDLKNKK